MKPAAGPASKPTAAKEKENKKRIPKVDELLNDRDYTGAITLLEVIMIF